MPYIAKDVQTGFMIHADAGVKKRKYTCVCPEAHAVCLRQGDKNVAHFAHIPVCGRDGDFIPSCKAGGESEKHIQAKQKLVEWQGCYQFALRTCEICRTKVREDCKNGQMKMEARSTDKRWQYDVLLTREDQSMLAMEVYHTHSTGDKKVSSSAILGVQIAEFDADAILNLNKGGWLDNKRDASWICSQQCKHQQEMELKRLAEARRQAQKQEQLKRQQAMEERRQAQQQEEFMRKCETLYQAQRQERMKQQEISSTVPVQAIQQESELELQEELERQDKLEKWRKYRVDLQEWESAQRLLQIKMAPKLPFKK